MVENKVVVIMNFVILVDSIVDIFKVFVLVLVSDLVIILLIIGSVYVLVYRGLVDVNWGIVIVIGNFDIKVYDIVKLGFSLMLNLVMNDLFLYDFFYYDVYYNIDDNLNLDYF